LSSKNTNSWEQTVAQLEEIMHPQSIAVVGASRNPQKEGTRIIQNLLKLGFEKVYPINPSAQDILGLHTYPSIIDVPDPIDLATIIIPPPAVPEVLRQCAEKGVKAAVIRTEGFAEASETGKKLQETLQEIIKSSTIRVFGPNTTGLLNSFSPAFSTSTFIDPENWRPGVVSWIAQTGMFAGAILRHITSSERFGIAKVFGLGNMVDVSEVDSLYYLAEDEQTAVISCYLEGIRDGPRFLHAAKRATAKKPVVILKGGRTPEGAEAALSHTASLVGDYKIFQTAAKQAEILLVDTFEELIAVSKAFVFQPLPKCDLQQKCRVGVFGFSGAINILSTDFLVQNGLQLAEFSKDSLDTLVSIFGPGKATNPIDSYPIGYQVGSEQVIKVALHAMLDDENVDAIFITCYSAGDRDFRASHLINALAERKNIQKPILVSVLGDKLSVDMCRSHLEEQKIPTYPFPIQALRVLSKMVEYSWYRTQIGFY